MNILITGADGFLGANLVKYLLPLYKIVGIVKKNQQIYRLSENEFKSGLVLYNEKQLNLVFRKYKFDYIIHTATHHAKIFKDFNEVFDVNVNLGLKIINKIEDSGNVVFINIDTILADNTNYYSFTKYIFREILKFISKNKHIKVFNLKLDMIYGPDSGAHNFIQQMFDKMLANEKYVELTKGIQKRSFLYIKDLTTAIYLLISNHKVLFVDFYESLYMANPKLLSIKETLTIIKQITKSTSLLDFGVLPYRENEIMKTIINNSFYKKINWLPKYTLKEGLTETYKSIIEKEKLIC